MKLWLQAKIFREQNDKGTEKEIFLSPAHNLITVSTHKGPLLWNIWE